MTAAMKSLALSLAFVSTIGSVVGNAQTSRPSTDTQTISRGWAALAAGRSSEAASIADGVLKKKPRSHAAFTLKIEALSAGSQPLAALDAYEAWIPKAGGNVDDRGLLQPIAAGLLRALSTDPDPAIRIAALRVLADAGDDSAIEALRKAGAAGDQRAMLALADNGDANAIASLQTLVASGNGRDMSAAINSLSEHGGLTPSLMETLAKDRVPMNRAAAADALARSKDAAASQLLDALSQDPDPLVHASVTLARAKNGDERALADARAMLASEVPDIRLRAAESLVATLPSESEQAVRPLLTNPDGLNRFRAAAIVGRSDPAAVQSVLMEGLAHQNPLIQQESARIVGETLTGNIVLLRQLLRHADRTIVVQAAGALVAN
jgi:HEAT repeat protein